MLKHPDLHDCGPTIKFIKYIRSVIKAMTSRCIQNSMRWQNEHYKVIVDFRVFLMDWRSIVGSENKKLPFMSDSTYDGFLVTLQTTVDVMDFLSEKCGYTYLMTTRLNQDALEVKYYSNN